jgi:hypothetical protein
VENKLREEQYGFRDNRLKIDLIFTVRQILEKRWEFGRDKCFSFIALEKANDTIKKTGHSESITKGKCRQRTNGQNKDHL